MAALTGGSFTDARSAEDVRRAMERSLALSYEVLDAQLAPVAVGYAGQGTIDVSDGRHTVVLHVPGKRFTVGDVRIVPDRRTEIVIRK